MQAVGGPQLQQQLLERWNGWLQGQVASIHSSQKFQELLEVAMQQWLAAAACVASLVLLLATIAAGEVAVCLASSGVLPAAPSSHHCKLPAGWVALWHTTMKDVGFFREIMGLNK